MNLVVKVVKNRAGNMLFLLVRGPTLAEWALKVCFGRGVISTALSFPIYKSTITYSRFQQRV